MAGNASYTVNAQVILASSQASLNENSLLTINGTKRTDLIQDIPTAGAALILAPLASVGLLICKVLTGSDPAATVSFFYDSGYADPIAQNVPQGTLALLLVNPGTIYAKASTSTVSVRVFAVEQ